MPILHLGVIDVPYVQAPPKPGRGRRRKVTAGTVTTGDVATWLENKYHVMEIYVETHLDDQIVPAIEDSLQGALENVLMGAPLTVDPFGAAAAAVEDGFKKFLSASEIETLGYPGIPTQAALKGVNPRLKLKRGPRRPSFIATGLYQASEKAWVD